MKIFEKQNLKTFSYLATPLLISFLAQKGMALIDTIMMGWIGPQALAAGALGTAIFWLIVVFCRGTLSAVGIFVTHARGASHYEDMADTIKQGTYLALLLSLPAMLMVWFSPQLLTLSGQNPLVVADTALLLHGLVWGFPGLFLFLVFREITAAFSLGRIVMLVTIVSLPLTALFNYVLIYGKYGLPRLGIGGIGYAGSLVMWIMFFCLLFYSKRHHLLKDHIDLKFSKFNKQKIKEMFYLGAPSGAIIVLDTGMFLIAALMMGYLGVLPLAAYQIVMQCASVAYNIPLAIAMSTGLQVSHAVGSKDFSAAKNLAYLGLTIGFVTALIIALLFILMPEPLIKLFISAQESNYTPIKEMATSFLTLAALFQCFDAIQVITGGILRGYKDTLVPLLICIPCYWLLGVGSAYYFAFHTTLHANGIWYGLTLGILSAAIVLLIRLAQKLKMIRFL